MTLPRLVTATARPVALVCLVLLGAAVYLTRAGAPPASHDRYSVLFWASAAGAALLLLILAAVPPAWSKRIRVTCLSGSGLLMGVLHGNGLTTGTARVMLLVALLLALVLAVSALVVSLEATQNKPVRRL